MSALVGGRGSVAGVVLAAGRGRRLGALTDRLCKPLLPLLNRSLLSWTCDRLSTNGADVIAVTSCYLGQQVVEALVRIEAELGVSLLSVAEPKLTGPIGGLAACRGVLPDRHCYLVANGDVYTSADLNVMVQDHIESDADLTVLTTEVWNPSLFGVLSTRGRWITGAVEKPLQVVAGALVNCGVYVLSARALADVPDPSGNGQVDFVELLERLLKRGRKILAHKTPAYWSDIGSIDSLVATNLHLLEPEILSSLAERVPNTDVWVQGPPGELPVDLRIKGRILLGVGVRVEDGVSIESSIIGTGARLCSGARLREAVVMPEVRVGWSSDEGSGLVR